MKRGTKIGLGIAGGIFVGFLVLFIWGYNRIRQSLPLAHGTTPMAGLVDSVNVYRDGYNIPHVLANSDRDLFFAQGYVTSQDRFWQMDLWRRMAAGRLAEILGPGALSIDRFMAVLGLDRIAGQLRNEISDRSLDILTAYAAGVNAFRKDYLQRLPIEFTLLQTIPDPWAVEDCLAVLRLWAWFWNADFQAAMLDGALLEKAGKAKAGRLPALPWNSGRSKESAAGGWFLKLMDSVHPVFFQRIFPKPAWIAGGWAISKNRSITGQPILAVAPVLSLTHPSFWYEIHLMADGFCSSGLSIPGLPLVITGYNSQAAWSLLPRAADDGSVDVLVKNGPVPPAGTMAGSASGLENGDSGRVQRTIRVRTNPDVRMAVWNVPGCAILNPLLDPEPDDVWISLGWSGFSPSDEILALDLLNRSQDWKSFTDALGHFHVPSLCALYADREGTIGVGMAGGFRADRSRIAGRSDRMEQNVSGLLATLKNPPSGWILAPAHTASLKDGKIEGNKYDPSERLRSWLADSPGISVLDCKQMQADVLSVAALSFRDALFKILGREESDGRNHGAADSLGLERLAQWNGEMKEGSSEAAIFETFVSSFVRAVFQDELGDTLYAVLTDFAPLASTAAFRVLGDHDSPWYDDIRTANIENRTDQIRTACREALKKLVQGSGADPLQWTWGSLHTMTFSHPLSGQPLLARVFNLGPFQTGGSLSTALGFGHTIGRSFAVSYLPSARFIIDVGNPDNSAIVLPTGQSGQPMDEHFKDQLPLFLNGQFHPVLCDSARIVHSGWNCVRFLPTSP